MLGSVTRLLSITILTISATFFALFFIRWLGLQQSFAIAPVDSIQSLYVLPPEELCSARTAPRPESWLVIDLTAQGNEWSTPCAGIDLKSLLALSPQANWLLIIHEAETQRLDHFIEIVSAFDQNKKFAIWSEAQKVARYLRKKAPQWSYAADGSSLLRLQIFSSMWIETATDFWPDFVIVRDGETGNAHFLTKRSIQELYRRHKPVFLHTGDKFDLMLPN